MNDRIAIIILAAGSSRRLGRAKQLVRVGGVTLVRRVCEVAISAVKKKPPPNPLPEYGSAALTAGREGKIVVVLGAGSDAVREELRGLDVRFVDNPDHALGIGTSIRAGMIAATGYDAAIIVPCDLPKLEPHILCAMINQRIQHRFPVAACDYGAGVTGPPTLFGSELFHELRAIPDDQGAKAVVKRHRDRMVTIPFPAGAFDIDTEEDLRLLEP